MRTSFLALLFLAAPALGCGPGPDPNLVECGLRKPGEVVLGTGEDEFEPVTSQGVGINSGSQGGQHIWLALSCKNLGPRVTAFFKITDVETGLELSEHGLASAVDLEYDGKGSDLAAGIYGYLALGLVTRDDEPGSGGGGGGGGEGPKLPSDLGGRRIKIEVDVADECKKPAIHAELLTVISS
jgi:hypothetical protein